VPFELDFIAAWFLKDFYKFNLDFVDIFLLIFSVRVMNLLIHFCE